MTKRVRLATFAKSIVENLCLLQRNKWNTIKIRSLVIINAPYGSKSISQPFLTFCQSRKKLAVVERLIFWQFGTQFSGRCCCREVEVSRGSTLRTSFETQGSYLDGGGGGKNYSKGWKPLTQGPP